MAHAEHLGQGRGMPQQASRPPFRRRDQAELQKMEEARRSAMEWVESNPDYEKERMQEELGKLSEADRQQWLLFHDAQAENLRLKELAACLDTARRDFADDLRLLQVDSGPLLERAMELRRTPLSRERLPVCGYVVDELKRLYPADASSPPLSEGFMDLLDDIRRIACCQCDVCKAFDLGSCCTICQGTMVNWSIQAPLCTLSCQHTHHVGCMMGWLRRGNRSCPVCRNEVTAAEAMALGVNAGDEDLTAGSSSSGAAVALPESPIEKPKRYWKICITNPSVASWSPEAASITFHVWLPQEKERVHVHGMIIKTGSFLHLHQQ